MPVQVLLSATLLRAERGPMNPARSEADKGAAWLSSRCIACDSGHVRADRGAYVTNAGFPLLVCGECGLKFLQIDEDPDDGFDHYWDEVNRRIYTDEAVVEELRRKYRRYLAIAVDDAPNPRLLDVGSGAGIFVDTAAREFGFEATGVEPSEIAVDLSRETYDVPVVRGLMTPDDELPRDFGTLTLWDVIEHVVDPQLILQTCADHLVPGGVLILETPKENTPMRAVIRGLATLGIPQLDVRDSIYYRDHRFYFTEPAMARMLDRAGFSGARFFTDHTMYTKELRKLDFYRVRSTKKRLGTHAMAFATRIVPALGNKMVVVARKQV
jgi:SAM-dependent methyltransferase